MRLLKVIFSLLLFTGVLAGCTTDDVNTPENGVEQDDVQTVQVDVVISVEHGEEILEEETLEVEDGSNLLDVMDDNFDVVIAEGGFVEAVNGVQAEDDEPYAWMYTINGEHAMVGAGDYIIEDGDLIEFDFHSWE